jgi:hypothetical protein
MSDVSTAIAGGPSGWSGLPRGFDETALRAEIEADWRERPEHGERVATMYRVLDGTRSDPPEHIEAWIRVGDDPINSLEFRPPGGWDHTAILADLGSPDLVLASNIVEPGASASDRVHAARGITVTVAEPFEHAGGDPYIVYVQVYAPTDVQGYVVRVGQAGYGLRPFAR